ncbi:MAG TPA: cupredoxin family copper-binding protein [Pseudolabrys sp.]|nr:cupredoxin family copper-binding protein [Pseudolabrys sp.]
MLAVVALLTLGSAARAEDVKVNIDNFTFEPQKLTVKVGTTVTWTNRDDIPHTVASSTKAFKSKVMDTDQSFSYTFSTPGEFAYFCSLHPHMTGTIVVEPQKSTSN